ncbi:MAG: hypothetical protein CM1200mP36_10000 [Gammaproteobacteria bacterium]|nr:MAG: hypothetical protein CM1200mP36_10000 [Gammaproteobacteria bacterium]
MREGSKLTVLRQRQANPTAELFDYLGLGAPPTRETERPALMAGRMPALNKSVSRKICPSVIEITFVGTKADTRPLGSR